MTSLFLMDPLETVKYDKDTTLALMVGAHKKNHTVYYLPKNGISRKNGQSYFHVTEVTPRYDPVEPFIIHKELVLGEDDVDILFIRTDPPFDAEYLTHTWLLDLLPNRIAVLNKPSGIRRANEKIWATQFTSIVPPTYVGRRKEELISFLNEYQNIVAKPIDGHGGKSVFHVQSADRNAKVILETLTYRWDKDVILQKYIPEAQSGDKRILLLNGEPLGAVIRMHSEDDHRNNFHAGGEPLKSNITVQDKKIIETIKPHLQKLGLYFVGIDILGNYLVEVNVTSPTCLQEMNKLDQKSLEDDVMAFAEKLVDRKEIDDTIIACT